MSEVKGQQECGWCWTVAFCLVPVLGPILVLFTIAPPMFLPQWGAHGHPVSFPFFWGGEGLSDYTLPDACHSRC